MILSRLNIVVLATACCLLVFVEQALSSCPGIERFYIAVCHEGVCNQGFEIARAFPQAGCSPNYVMSPLPDIFPAVSKQLLVTHSQFTNGSGVFVFGSESKDSEYGNIYLGHCFVGNGRVGGKGKCKPRTNELVIRQLVNHPDQKEYQKIFKKWKTRCQIKG